MTNETDKRLENMADTLYGMLELAKADQRNIQNAIQNMTQTEQRLVQRVDLSVQNNVRAAFDGHSEAFHEASTQASIAADKLRSMTRGAYLRTVVLSCLTTASIAAAGIFFYVPSMETINERREQLELLDGQISYYNIDIRECSDVYGDKYPCAQIDSSVRLPAEVYNSGYRVFIGR